jgi:hypothetical protein
MKKWERKTERHTVERRSLECGLQKRTVTYRLEWWTGDECSVWKPLGWGRGSLGESNGPPGTSGSLLMPLQNVQQETFATIQEIRCVYG